MKVTTFVSHCAALLFAFASFVLAFFLLVNLGFMVPLFLRPEAKRPYGGGRHGESSFAM